MTYEKIANLKFKKKVPTTQLQKYFPNEIGKIGQVALAELPVRTLKCLIPNQKKLKQLLELKAELKKRDLYC